MPSDWSGHRELHHKNRPLNRKYRKTESRLLFDCCNTQSNPHRETRRRLAGLIVAARPFDVVLASVECKHIQI